MELKILNETKNALFKRKEVILEVAEAIVPSTEDVRAAVAEKFSVDAGLVEILDIKGRFGVSVFKIRAHLYENKEAKESTVLKSKKQRDGEKKAIEDAKKAAEEEAKAAEEAKNAPKEETPAEETKEETSVEEVKAEEKVTEKKE